ncbi:MAG: peptidase S41 [Gammaproteobacteria bacterium BRH_c0]|nr:MAG: peptidase S41 [Gammaproteobacteria bacterium BRH_c0]
MKFLFRITGIVLLSLASAQVLSEDVISDEDARLPLEDLQLFVQIFDQIRSAYVEEVDDKTLFENAIKGLLGGLDPHSSYLDESTFDELQENTSGEFGGLGIEVGMEGGLIKVVAPIDDTPAYRAGIKAGDLIIKLDDNAVQGMNIKEAIDLMRGPEGSPIVLTILREGMDAPLEITIVRDIIKVKSVRSEILEDGFGYVRIAQFQTDTGAQFRNALESMIKKSDPLQGVVIDLRNNPGGLLPSSVEVADALLDDGLIVYTEGRIPSANIKFRATQGDVLAGIPVVVIINSGSASAAEIVAGALQDHHRAIVIGTQSFGKGSVQTVLPLKDGKAIKLTTARYLTPDGHSIQAQGIKPDIVVAPAEIKMLDEQKGISEANLSGHLKNIEVKKSTTKRKSAKASIADDNQLYEALNILKGIAIFKS